MKETNQCTGCGHGVTLCICVDYGLRRSQTKKDYLMYLSKCTYVEEHKPVHTYIFTGNCIVTHEPYTVRLPANGLFFYNHGMLVQNAFPSVSAEDREFITSGVSPKGWALMTQDSEDEGS